MPRIARKNYESNYFHVIVQGYEKQYIFDDNYFKKKYIKLLKKEMNNYEVEILEYCIMDNHAHILLFCEQIEQMSKYMKSVNIQYAIFYNREKNRVGYVFRDRYLSEPIMSERYLYNCIGYIHMNPVNAKMTICPEDYLYSSYMEFINKNGVVTDSVLIKLFGSTENYLPLFRFLHLSCDEGKEYVNDPQKISLNNAEDIINEILYEYVLLNIDLSNDSMQRYFYKLFLKKGIKEYQISKILKVSRGKIKRILNQ